MTAERMPLPDDVAERWASTDAVGFLQTWTGDGAGEHPHAEHTGNRLAEVRRGFVVMRWLPGPQLANLSGAVHGGYLALVCDEACGMAAASTGERFVPMLTLDLDVTYLRPGAVGLEHRVEGEVLHAGSQRIVSEARVLRPDGALVASARGSFVANSRFVDELAAGLRTARS